MPDNRAVAVSWPLSVPCNKSDLDAAYPQKRHSHRSAKAIFLPAPGPKSAHFGGDRTRPIRDLNINRQARCVRNARLWRAGASLPRGCTGAANILAGAMPDAESADGLLVHLPSGL